MDATKVEMNAVEISVVKKGGTERRNRTKRPQ